MYVYMFVFWYVCMCICLCVYVLLRQTPHNFFLLVLQYFTVCEEENTGVYVCVYVCVYVFIIVTDSTRLSCCYSSTLLSVKRNI